MKDNTNTTPINHGRIPYLCSKRTSKHTFCTSNADVKMTTGNKAILCNEHAGLS